MTNAGLSEFRRVTLHHLKGLRAQQPGKPKPPGNPPPPPDPDAPPPVKEPPRPTPVPPGPQEPPPLQASVDSFREKGGRAPREAMRTARDSSDQASIRRDERPRRRQLGGSAPR